MNKKNALIHYKFLRWNDDSSGTGWPLYPHGFEETIRKGPISYSEQNCQHMIVIFMIAGRLLYRCREMEYLIGPRNIFVIPAGSDYMFKTTQEEYYHKLVIEIKGSLLPVTCTALRLDSPQVMKAESPDETDGIERTMRDFEKLFLEGFPNGLIRALSQVYGLLSQLSLKTENAIEQKHHPLVVAARFKLENNIFTSLNMSNLARELGVCKSRLNQQFRAEIGLSLLQYHIQVKMREAKRLLTCTNLTIKEIAYRVGYVNQLYFSSVFRKNSDMSPREFRNKTQMT